MRKYTIAFGLIAGLAACGGDSRIAAPPPPPPPTALLREINIPLLPSPFYKFDYDANGRITTVEFASGFRVYTAVYDGSRLVELRNDAVGNKDRVQYIYDDAGRVSNVNYIDADGVTFTRISLGYDGAQLVLLKRERILNDAFVLDKIFSMIYDANGNLLELGEHFPAVPGFQTEATFVDLFENYDDKINVDAFSLIHDEFFDNLVLLPGVVLQKGNPTRVLHLGTGDNYSIDYTYTYDAANRPLTKIGDLTYTNAPKAGQKLQLRSDFSYF